MNSFGVLLMITTLLFSANVGQPFDRSNSDYENDKTAIICSLDEKYNHDDPISIIVELNYSSPSFDLNLEIDTIDMAQEYINEIRALNKDYYSEMNLIALEELRCDCLPFTYSSYSPFLFCEFDNYDNYIKSLSILESINEKEIVNRLFVEPLLNLFPECTVNTGDSLALIPIETAKNMIGINSTSYTGDGIKVGILDGGIPYSTNFSGGQIKGTYGTSYSDHTTKVTSIIGGTYGIATNADLYIRSYSGGLDSSIEWLLDCGVNVINMSMGSSLGAIYDGRSAYLDYLVANEYVSIVKSAGNERLTKFITSPGMGLNVFAVGSIDGDKNISDYSSYSVDSTFYDVIMKPTLVAPGENIIIPNTINSALNDDGTALLSDYSGTSFAAPMVTGCLALLMEQFPQLIVSPELAMSAIVNGAKKLPSQTTLWDDNCGAGLLNYSETVSILSDGYILANVPNNASNGFLAGSRSFIVPAKSFVDLSFIHIIRSTTTSPSSGSTPLTFSKYSIIITDSNGLTVVSSSSNSNLQLLTVDNTGLSPITLTASIYLNGSKLESGTEYSALTFSTYHTHSYSYLWKSYTQHRTNCVCGINRLEGHAVSSGSFIQGNQYATCLLCGGPASMGFIVPLSLNDLPRSANGSFILPNGVVVLVDEDFDAYLNGTLVFIDPNLC